MKYQRVNKTLIAICLLFILTGCIDPEVNYNEMFNLPSAKIINNELILKGGPSNIASASYVVPHAKIKDNQIYVYGTLSFSQKKIQKNINLPKANKDWKIYWVNKDYSLIEFQN